MSMIQNEKVRSQNHFERQNPLKRVKIPCISQLGHSDHILSKI